MHGRRRCQSVGFVDLRTFRQVQSNAAWERMGYPCRGVDLAESFDLPVELSRSFSEG